MNSATEPFAKDGKNTTPAAVAEVAAMHGLAVLGAPDIVTARTLAAQLIGEGVAPTTCLVSLQAHFPASVFGLHQNGALTGLLAAFPLNRIGLRAVEQARFDAVHLDLAQVAKPGEAPAAYYGWGFAATNKDGARAVLRASIDIHRLLYWATPTFARAVTADGVRALSSIGFCPHPNQQGLFFIAPAAAPGLQL
jgi:hypothetical protein